MSGAKRPTGAGDASVFKTGVADRVKRTASEAALRMAFRADPCCIAGLYQLRRLDFTGAVRDPPAEDVKLPQAMASQSAADVVLASVYVPANVQDVEEHLQQSEGCVHPFSKEAETGSAPPSLRAAVTRLSQWGVEAANGQRERRLRSLRAISDSLRPLSLRLYAEFAPQHIVDADGPRIHAAWLACIAEVFGLDDRILEDTVLCLYPVGEVPPSGAFQPIEPTAGRAPPSAERFKGIPFDSLDHAAWNAELAASVSARWQAATAPGRRDEAAEEGMRAIWKATLAERDKGLMAGPFCAADLDAAYGHGAWRASRRFPIYQKEKCRPCDDCAESGHNVATVVSEKLACDTADFPLVVAALFAECTQAGKPLPRLHGGTDDIEAAYRRALSATPQFTPTALIDPDTGEVVYFTLPGLNFGLSSAPISFNRYPRLAVHLLRRVLAVPVTNFYDDFCTVEPAFTKGSGQKALWTVMEDFGLPLARQKHPPMATVFCFLGVEFDASRFASDGIFVARVSQERYDSIADSCDYHRGLGRLSGADAARLTGRLNFATSWAAGWWGKAVLRPLHDLAKGEAPDGALRPSTSAALRFFSAALRRPGGLPPRELDLSADHESGRPAVRIYSDAMYVPGQPAGLGFVNFFPASSDGPALVVHSATQLPVDFVKVYYYPSKSQYIGQLELLAAIVPYVSLAEELEGCDMVHWVDNKGAAAALVKGYSSANDCVGMLHAFAALRLRLGVNIWFEYVRSKANIADLPSRAEFGMLRRMGSRSVPFRLPPMQAFSEPLGIMALVSSRAIPKGPQLGSIAIANAISLPALHQQAGEEAVITRMARSPLANPFPVCETASRAEACAACGQVFTAGRSVLAVAADREGDPLPFAEWLASPQATLAREAAVAGLARRVANGACVRLVCVCYPRQCHASTVAQQVRRQAGLIQAAAFRNEREAAAKCRKGP